MQKKFLHIPETAEQKIALAHEMSPSQAQQKLPSIAIKYAQRLKIPQATEHLLLSKKTSV
ncbi:hypothetical protein V8J88_01530 [Massilia sp. W12]|uniref:hypothetical protein n=1 Tax=Massilia sp. W12 TaxID=3126507 RepID=UPI0030D4D5EC